MMISSSYPLLTHFVLIMNQKKFLSVELKLIHAELFQAPPCNSFTLSILHHNHQYNTSTFRVSHQLINLKQCSPIAFSFEDSKQPLLRVMINGCDSNCRYETQIESKVLEAIVIGGNGGRKVRRRHALAFPLFGKGNNVAGDLKIKLSILENKGNTQNLNNLASRQRKVVVSQMTEEYFQPVYSKMIRVCIDECPNEVPQEQSARVEEEKRQIKIAKNDPFEPFRQQISQISLRQSCQERLNEQQECEMAQLANPTPAHLLLKTTDKPEDTDIPQDCRYLFQKINEINKRYAPLQKIPSQEEFSDYSQLNNGDCRLGQESEEEEIVHPLQEVQDLLKQLDLYKFAQGLIP